MNIVGTLERLGRRLAGPPWSADRGKEIVQPRRQIGPGHLELARPVVDDLVADAGTGIDGGTRDKGVRHPVDEDRASPLEAEQDLPVRRVAVLPHKAARRDYLDTHRQVGRTGLLGAELDD